jgi:cytochrome c biogenesis protein CcmG/thiol:disulfide interchange protein DsbE
MRWLRNILRRATGGRTMAALTVGTKAPNADLKTLDGKRFSLSEALARGPVGLAFFKVSCPVCQYAFSFLERLHKAYRQKGYTLVGVSQDDAKETAAFNKEFGLTFPMLLDDTRTYPVSNAYGLTNVPTLFWIAADGEIEVSSVGWVKADLEEVGRKMAEAGKIAVATVFKPGEEVADFRAG